MKLWISKMLNIRTRLRGLSRRRSLRGRNNSAGTPVPQMLCAALLAYAAAPAAVHAAMDAAVVLPALTQPASGEHHVGKIVWADLVTPDIDGAKRFYGALFGWTFRDVPGGTNY